MKQYAVKTLTEGRHKLFYIHDNESYEIVLHPSKYLKYKIDTNCSPNTVRRIAFALSYYMEYLSQQELELIEVGELGMRSKIDTLYNFCIGC